MLLIKWIQETSGSTFDGFGFDRTLSCLWGIWVSVGEGGTSENCKSQRPRHRWTWCLENMAAPCSDTCEAKERSLRERVPPLLTDLYQFTMAYAYWRSGRHQEPAVFELFFRDNPFGGGFSLFAGLEDCLLFLRSFHFTDEGESWNFSLHMITFNNQI